MQGDCQRKPSDAMVQRDLEQQGYGQARTMGHLVRERQEAVCGCLVGPINQLGGDGEGTGVAVARSQPQQHHVRCRSDASQPGAREVRGVLHSLLGATSGAERPLVLKGLLSARGQLTGSHVASCHA